jgi:hypothetical protein
MEFESSYCAHIYRLRGYRDAVEIALCFSSDDRESCAVFRFNGGKLNEFYKLCPCRVAVQPCESN